MAMVNGLYDVPQTDTTSEAAMADLVARLRTSIPKPETIPLESAEPGTDARLAIRLAGAVGLVRAALGDHLDAGNVLVKWDAALDEVCRDIAYRKWMNLRGRERKQGADNSIDAAADEALAFLARCRPGGDENGKTENPTYHASPSDIPGDRGRFKSSKTSDAWVCGSRGGD